MEALVKRAYEQLYAVVTDDNEGKEKSKKKKSSKNLDESVATLSLEQSAADLEESSPKSSKDKSKKKKSNKGLDESVASLSLEQSAGELESPTKKKKKKKLEDSVSSLALESATTTEPAASSSPKKKKSSSSSSSSSSKNDATLASALQTIRDYSDVAVCPESGSIGTQILDLLRQGLPAKEDGIALIVSAVRSGDNVSSNGVAVGQATAALANSITDPKTHVDALANADGIVLLFSALHDYPHVSAIVLDTLRILTVVAESNDDEHKVAILTARPEKNGAIFTILQAMNAQLGVSMPVQAQACALLHALTAVDKGREKIIQAGGIVSIYAALKTYQKDKKATEVCKHGRTTLRHLLPEPVADALEQMQDYSEWTKEEHVITLRQFASEEANKVPMAQAGSIDAIVEAMKRNTEKASLQEQACGALLSLSSAKSADKNHPDFDPDSNNKKMIVEAGGIEAIVTALQTHHAVMDVQAYGCRTMWSLSTLNDNKAIIGNKEMGGIPAILQAMKGHEKVAIVFENAMPALAELAADTDNGKAIGLEEGAIDTVLTAMKNHPTNAQVQQYSCHVFSNLAVNDENKASIAKAGGIGAILGCMKSNANQPGVQIYACSALGNLALATENKETIANEGGIETILQAMSAHGTHVAVLDKACGALRNLSIAPHIKALIKEAGGVAAVTDALRNHPQLEMVASAVLKNLNG